ncbi:MAG: hypothetical protein HRU75_12415 [Planctomycetia bacterium]|nr:MAG: hypothetical protein HRU75_12415 [Planctomycetia bacterium]
MRRNLLKTLSLAAAGAIVFQTTSCIDVTSGVTAIATTVTAGGVIYLITRVLE